MAERGEVDEAYYAELAERAYAEVRAKIDGCDIFGDSERFQIQAEVADMPTEQAVDFLRQTYWRALSDSSRLNPEVGVDVEAGGISMLGNFTGIGFDADRWHEFCLKVDVSTKLMRERLAKYLQDGQRVADLGCGTGLSTLPLLKEFPKVSVIGFDDSMNMIERFLGDAFEVYNANGRVEVRSGNLEGALHDPYLQNLNGRFDQVVANGVFYYLKNLASIFEFVARILKGGGHFHFSLPVRSGGINEMTLASGRVVNRECYLQSAKLIYFYGKDELMALAAKNGMRLVEEDTQFVHREEDKRNDVHFTFFTLKRA